MTRAEGGAESGSVDASGRRRWLVQAGQLACCVGLPLAAVAWVRPRSVRNYQPHPPVGALPPLPAGLHWSLHGLRAEGGTLQLAAHVQDQTRPAMYLQPRVVLAPPPPEPGVAVRTIRLAGLPPAANDPHGFANFRMQLALEHLPASPLTRVLLAVRHAQGPLLIDTGRRLGEVLP